MNELESKILLAEALIALTEDPRWDRFVKAITNRRDLIVRKLLAEDLADATKLGRYQGEIKMLEWLAGNKESLKREYEDLKRKLQVESLTPKVGAPGVSTFGVGVPLDRSANVNPYRVT